MFNLDVFGYIAPVLILLITELGPAAWRTATHAPVLVLILPWLIVFFIYGLVVAFQVAQSQPSGIIQNKNISIAPLIIAFYFAKYLRHLFSNRKK